MFSRTTSRRSALLRIRPAALLETLEDRRLMAKTQLITFGGDTFSLTLTGPGTFADVTPNSFGVPLIALTGTTIASDFSVQPAATRAGPGAAVLNIETITGGTLNSLTLNQDRVRISTQDILAPRGITAIETGILLTGYARSITVGDVFGGDIRLDSTSSLNRSIISARQVAGNVNLGARGTPDVSNITSGGVIDSFTASTYSSGTIRAARIGSIDINSDDALAGRGFILVGSSDFDIVTTSTTATFGVKTITIRGSVLGGDWQIAAPVQRIQIGDVVNNDFLRGTTNSFNINVQGRIGQLISQNDLRGTATARSFGSIQAGDFVDMSFTANAAASNTNLAIDSLRAATLNSTISATNGIGLLNVGTLIASTINAGWINIVNVTGAPGISEVISNSSISLNNAVRQSVNTKINVQGVVSNSTINSTRDLGDIAVRGLISSRILVGVGNITALPTTLGAFTTNSTIRSFTMSAPLDNSANFVSSIVVAAIMGRVTVTAPNVTTANGGALFGIAANTIGPVSYTAGPGANFSANELTASAAVSVGDFRIVAI